MTSIKTLLQTTSIELANFGIEHSALEARILLSHAIGCSESYLIGHGEEALPQNIIEKFEALIIRRKNFEPIAYILGEREFYGRGFKITPDVLIPRHDTETIIEAVINKYSDKDNLRILDLGVGSGCILISLLLELSNSTGVGVDISEKALEIAKYNAVRHQVQEKCHLVISDWLENVNGEFDIIISNPPYISKSETPLMAKETLEYEPEIALFAAENGLENYKIIAEKAKDFLASNGKIYIEMGSTQEKEVEQIFVQNGYTEISKYKDLGGHTRCLGFMLLAHK